MSTLNPLNDLSRIYLDTVAKINKNEEENEVKRWEGELNLQMKTQASLAKESKDESPEEEEEDRKKDDDLAGAPNKNGKNGKKKVKRWWDDDGDGKGYEDHEVKKEDAQYGYDSKGRSKNPVDIEKRKRKDDNLAGAPLKKEEIDNSYIHAYVAELNKATLGSYVKKASQDLSDRRFDQGDSEKRKYDPDAADDKEEKKLVQREKGISRAATKLVKKESFSDWRNDLREIVSDTPMTDTEAQKIVKEKKVDNKVVINPKMTEAIAEIGGELISETEVELQEKKDKDTPDQVKAVIAYDRARHATDDATYDTEHGKKKQAKKERDYAKWQRDTGARDAQKSGHPWEHEKYGTREKEGKKSVKHAHVKDSYDPLYNEGVVGKEVKELQKAGKTLKDTPVVKADKTDTPNYKGNKFGVKEAKDWIQGAVKRPGAFTRKAKAAGMSVQQFAKHVDANKSKYSTRTERQANLAQTFASMKKEDVEEMIYLMIVEEDRLKKFEAWIQFDEGYQRNPEADPRSARQKRMDDPDTGINSPAFRKFMADREKASSAKKVKKSAPTKSKPNPQGTLHLSPEERKKREAKRREDLYKRSADMRRDHKKRGIGVYAKGAKNPGADMDKKLGI